MQNPSGPIDEEESPILRELVEQIDSHMELDEMEVTSNPRANDQLCEDISQPTINQQLTETVAQTQPTDPTV